MLGLVVRIPEAPAPVCLKVSCTFQRLFGKALGNVTKVVELVFDIVPTPHCIINPDGNSCQPDVPRLAEPDPGALIVHVPLSLLTVIPVPACKLATLALTMAPPGVLVTVVPTPAITGIAETVLVNV